MHSSDFRNTNMTWINGPAKHPSYYLVEAGAKIRVYCTVRKALSGGHEQGPGGCPWDEATQGRSVGWKRLCWLLDHNCRGESSTWIFPVVRQNSSMRWAQGGLRASALVSNSRKPWEAEEVLSNPAAAAALAFRRPTGLSDRGVGAGTVKLDPAWAMPANLTEGSSPANQTMPMLDASPVACTEIATFTEVLAAEEWGSFYSSFKVRVLTLKAEQEQVGLKRTVGIRAATRTSLLFFLFPSFSFPSFLGLRKGQPPPWWD